MSTLKYTCLLLFMPFLGFSQETINGTITHNGVQRSYILYLPAVYDGMTPMPLVLNFHGYGSNASEQMWYGDFRSIADTAGFLIVHPLGSLFNGITHWNVGGFTLGSTADDLGFTALLLDSLVANYAINADRIYATGMSNGGYMSFLLGCQLSDRIAALASVTGSMTPQITSTCNPERPVPVMQIHGTNDGVVPYSGASWTNAIPSVIQFWVDNNTCDPLPTVVTLPDVVTTDGSTVEHSVYSGGDKGAVVEHFKVINGGHTWPGSVFSSNGTNQDINASKEIWRFFSQYDLNGLINTSSVDDNSDLHRKLEVFPNPTQSVLYLNLADQPLSQLYQIYDLRGQFVASGGIQAKDHIDLSNFAPGVYLLKIGAQSTFIIRSEKY